MKRVTVVNDDVYTKDKSQRKKERDNNNNNKKNLKYEIQHKNTHKK